MEKINIAELSKDYLQPSYIKQTLRDKLKDCDEFYKTWK